MQNYITKNLYTSILKLPLNLGGCLKDNFAKLVRL